ncbi:MAG: hypothetical protein ACXVX4_13600 [Mycobacterium sp.]
MLVVLAACVGLYYAIRARGAKGRNRNEVGPGLSEEIAARADQQVRWAQRGDARGVYGVEGAELMRRVDPEPQLPAGLANTADYPKTAAVAYTAGDLDTVLEEKLPCWRWAAFASVLVQRRAAVQSRLRDDQLGYAAPSGERASSGYQVGRFVIDRMDEMLVLVKQVEDFMLTPAFTGVFGDPGDESSADGEGIVHTANRLMDYHARFLGMVERSRGLAVASEHGQLMHDLARLLDVPVASNRTFIDDFVERVGEMPEMLYYAHGGTVELDPVVLHMDVDDQLLKRISQQLSEIASH